MVGNNQRTRKFKIVIGLLTGLIVALLGIGSLHLYDYTENDPQFCLNCHLMKDAFHSWETSVHKGVNCHTCHHATLYEKNLMFLKTIVERPKEVTQRPHEQIIVPSTECITCHLAGDPGIIKVSKSKGHSLHWFKENIECTACHAIELHRFAAEQTFCLNCHSQAQNMVPKMKDMACSGCHNFKTGRLVPGNKECIQCHAEKSPLTLPAEASRAHQPFECNDCHQVHQPKKTAAIACTGCHQGAVKRGKHPIHLKALGNDCSACHAPHLWKVTQAAANQLCSQCHQGYPLKTFSKG